MGTPDWKHVAVHVFVRASAAFKDCGKIDKSDFSNQFMSTLRRKIQQIELLFYILNSSESLIIITVEISAQKYMKCRIYLNNT